MNTTSDPEIRALFTREALLASDWYHERLATKQQRDIALWSLTEFLTPAGDRQEARAARHRRPAGAELERVGAEDYLTALIGTVGANSIHRPARGSPGPEARLRGVEARGMLQAAGAAGKSV